VPRDLDEDTDTTLRGRSAEQNPRNTDHSINGHYQQSIVPPLHLTMRITVMTQQANDD
jgi:hypothetical protein